MTGLIEDEPPAMMAPTDLSVSPGLAKWLTTHKVSLAFTTYQSGQLFLVGVQRGGAISVNQQLFRRAMGLAWQPGRLILAGEMHLWRLENVLRLNERARGEFDQLFVPRGATLTGRLNAHEIGIDRDGNTPFVNTRYSCLALPDPVHSFRPIWRPGFVSALAGEDRCHLNGLAMQSGVPRYVTAIARTDTARGWREERRAGGVVLSLPDGGVLIDALSMPHSPRVVGDRVLVLESGRGRLLDVTGGVARAIAFCPGFLRGLAVHDGFAIVTLSKPRYDTFAGLPLEDALAERGEAAWCGVAIVRLDTGAIVEWIRLEGGITEMFDVVAMPGVRCPMSLAPNAAPLADTITIADG